jgi:hypothetical protein
VFTVEDRWGDVSEFRAEGSIGRFIIRLNIDASGGEHKETGGRGADSIHFKSRAVVCTGRTNKMRRQRRIEPCEEKAQRRHETNIKPTIHFHRILISFDGQDEVQFTFKFPWAWSSPPKLHCSELKTNHVEISNHVQGSSLGFRRHYSF